jgi:hypothetical protein
MFAVEDVENLRREDPLPSILRRDSMHDIHHGL